MDYYHWRLLICDWNIVRIKIYDHLEIKSLRGGNSITKW